VAFEMLSGEKARPQPNPVALAHAIATRPPPDLCEISAQASPAAAAVLRRGMAADPAERPRSAGELVERLRAALGPERRTEPDPPRVPARPPAVAAPPAPPTPDPLPVAAPPAPRIPEPAPVPIAAARARPTPAAGGRKGPAGAGALRGKRPLILAGLAAFGLAALALGLLESGTGTAPRKTAGPSHGTAGSTAGRSTSTASSTSAANGSGASGSGGAATTGGGGTASTVASGSGTGVTANPDPSTPAGAVQAFYLRAARHDFAGAWTLADPAFQTQLAGYRSFAAQQSAVRRITFHRAQTTFAGQNTARVDVETTAELTSKTQECRGPVTVVRGPSGGWVLDRISIDCT
ncbi:MAG: hypothetical protein QOD61_2734, partial [Solirubrobacteraceae bacterium]|nr:hypothetical protein [Solirubrobacteraceae bacterium]